MTPAEKRNAVLDRWAAGHTLGEIAAALGLPRPESASVIVQRARAKGDKRAVLRQKNEASRLVVVLFPRDLVEAFKQEGRRRNCTPRRLMRAILRTVASANLYAAVLDE